MSAIHNNHISRIPSPITYNPPSTSTLNPSSPTSGASTASSGSYNLQDLSLSQLQDLTDKLLSSGSLSPMEQQILQSMETLAKQTSNGTSFSAGSVSNGSGFSGTFAASGPDVTGGPYLVPVPSDNPAMQGTIISGTLTPANLPILATTSSANSSLSDMIANGADYTTAPAPVTTAAATSSTRQKINLVQDLQNAASLEQAAGNSYAAGQYADLLNKFEGIDSPNPTLLTTV